MDKKRVLCANAMQTPGKIQFNTIQSFLGRPPKLYGGTQDEKQIFRNVSEQKGWPQAKQVRQPVSIFKLRKH